MKPLCKHTLRKYTNQIVDAEASVARVIALQKQREKDLEKLGEMVTSAVEAAKNEKDPVKAGKLENTAIDLALKQKAQTERTLLFAVV